MYTATPACAGAVSLKSGGFQAQHTETTGNIQRVANAIGTALELVPACGQPGHRTPTRLALDLVDCLRSTLTHEQRLTIAAAAMFALPPDTAEELAEATLHDLRAGPPTVWFWSLRDESLSWAMFASRAERCHYLAAAWGQLSPDDRRRFLRRAL